MKQQKPTNKPRIKLTFKQRLFCRYYLETFGNGTEAVIKAGYKVKENRKSAACIASENLKKPKISQHINLSLKQIGLNDTTVQLHHLSLIKQDKNLHAKNRAIDMYYKLNGKYLSIKLEGGYDEKLKQFLDEMDKELPQ